MKRAILPLSLLFVIATALLLAQQPRPRPAGDYPQWEVKVLHPQEIAAGRYSQVRPYELDNMAAEGWELVGMSQYVLRNEEHQGPNNERPMVTQAYMSYAFKRLKRTQ
jgi:hypothetical protein